MADSAAPENKAAMAADDQSFDSQIVGYHDEVERLKSVARAVRDIAQGKVKVGEMPKGILLSGRPGVGKTTMAKAFAAATGLPLITTDDPLDEDTIHALYEEAKKKAPAVVLIDDVDKIVPEDSDDGYSSDEARGALKECISQLDGMFTGQGIVTVMTTNYYGYLDDALKRPGRIDLHIPVGLPTDSDRLEILTHYMSKYGDAFLKEGLPEAITKKSHSMSCAALKTIVNDVWLQYYADYQEGKDVDWIGAFQKRILELRGNGLLKNLVKNDEDFRRICYHEAGHAIVEYALTGNTSDVCVLQVSDDSAGGWTAPRADDLTKTLWTLADCRNEAAAAMGGMASEDIVFGEHTTSVSDDVGYTENLISYLLGSHLYDAECPDGAFKFGLSPSIMPGDRYTDASSQTAGFIEALRTRQVHEIRSAYSMARKTLEENRGFLDELAEFLRLNGLASGEMVEEIAKKHMK